MRWSEGKVSPWADVLGAVYTPESLGLALGLDADAIRDAVAGQRVLRVHTLDGFEVFPSFQVSRGALVPGLHEVLLALGNSVDPLTIAQFLNTPVGDPPRRHIERLVAGDVDVVMREATRLAWSMSE